jgi:hypothetical protein
MNKKFWLLFFFLMSFSLGHSQNGKITGKVNLLDTENKSHVLDSTYIILASKSIRDSVKLDDDFSFHFSNLPSDTFYISFSRRSYPYDSRYVIYLRNSEIEKVNIDYSSTCPYDKTKDGVCPICKMKDEVIPIHYGLITSKIEKGKKQSKRKYYPGGCLIFDCQASWYCERDKKEF